MIAIIDYQMGNLRSVQKGFERVGHAAAITSDPTILAKASKLVLPGVGAFADAIAELHRRELVGPIRDAIDERQAVSGNLPRPAIVVRRSYEDGEHEGLGIIPGEVRGSIFPASTKCRTWAGTKCNFSAQGADLRRASPTAAHFYFVHSYHVVPTDKSVVDGEAVVSRSVLRDDLARQSLRHAVPSREESTRRPASACGTSRNWR